MKRVPLRIRLTLAFAMAMAVVLAAAGLFIHARVSSDLDASINDGLRARAGDLMALVQQSDTGLREARGARLLENGAEFSQVLDARGRPIDATPGFGSRSVLRPADLAVAKQRTVIFPRRNVALEGPVRLLAHPVTAQGQRLVIVNGASLEDRDQALAKLANVMLIGGPAALVLACLAGYALAAMALRPVERMRHRAENISTHRLSTRLPQTGSRDEIDRLAATLNESLDRVERGVTRQRDFVADASHQLRTPLTVLRTQLEVTAREHPDDEELQLEIASAIEEVDRLARLADDMLRLARADRAQADLVTEPADAQRLLTRVAERMSRYSPGRVTADAGGPELWVRADEPRVEQALENLVDNALGHGAGDVTLEAREAAGAVELHVLDEGPGFDPAFAPVAFERFTQAQPGRALRGAGLGLAIVRAIAEAHGGSAHIADRPGGGADAWISLPRSPAAQVPSIVSAQSSDGR